MTEWSDGYCAALADVLRLTRSRSLRSPGLMQLVDELVQDARVIEHEQGNRLQKRRLAAAREAELPLFAAAGEEP